MLNVRPKEYYRYLEPRDVLDRCRFDDVTDWSSSYGQCFPGIKIRFKDIYQCGGIWKSKKR
ncbi:MAG: hypothetical protein CMD99_05065 [Gammaproteobacteria bacterium]|nr:hypothetical protein [Gammaproteobacteria bacterium]